ncbi:uncharacterized protein LOC119102207 [Pollicipes pollicipes]|uniref:uncharacterized protein LOC119102207 n=1 Tax=Pollicipes pollicipes TaxID=41117 RepID=UPI001884F69D|nr:uncharacterized protein LOC119102207 [Pollicipes pollicipes]
MRSAVPGIPAGFALQPLRRASVPAHPLGQLRHRHRKPAAGRDGGARWHCRVSRRQEQSRGGATPDIPACDPAPVRSRARPAEAGGGLQRVRSPAGGHHPAAARLQSGGGGLREQAARLRYLVLGSAVEADGQDTAALRAKRFIRRLRRHGHSFLDSYFYLAKYDSTESRKRSFYEIWLYSTPFKSKKRFQPTGKPQEPRPTNRTLDTIRRLCRGLECPQFEVLSEHRGGIQKRHYYNAVFATSRMDGCDSSIQAMWRGLMPLHLYRQGINSHLEVIEATRPIGVLRVHEAVPARNTSCRMTSLMYLPRRLHQNPPNTGPSAPPTSLAYVHDLHVYVQTVGGFVLEPGRVADEVTAFRAELDALRLCYRPDQYFVAVYDFIQRYHGRLNEVWLVARRCRG